ncbi:MAG: hypothetical protein AB7C89_03970 [Intestinibacillus sp.]
MGCYPGAIGLAALALGIGILIGGLLPSWCIVWILGIGLIIVAMQLLRLWF